MVCFLEASFGHNLRHFLSISGNCWAPSEDAKKQSPSMYSENNGMAYSVILKCGIYSGEMSCNPLSIFDNPWTKNTVQAFDGNAKKIYFIGNIAPSGSFKPGDRSQFSIYKTNLYHNFIHDDFSAETIDKKNSALLLRVPAADTHFKSDTTYPFFDPLTTNDPKQECALFTTTIRTKFQSGIAILCLKKSALEGL